MQNLISKIDKVWIAQASRKSKVALRLVDLFTASQTEIEFFEEDPFAQKKGQMTAEQFSASKRTLVVKPFLGSFFKRCPGASQKQALTCCNYFVLNLGQQCNMNCSYCYLQSYLNYPALVVYSNIDQAIDEITRTITERGLHNSPGRIGTGEVIDSLSLDPLTLFSHDLIEMMKLLPHWELEFKTKSDCVDQFIKVPHTGNVTCSWSVNTRHIIASEEHETATLDQRLTAARKVANHGFKVAFHIDPMIYYPQWKQGYFELFQEITSLFKPEEVKTISLGSLRIQPQQRHIMRDRFGMLNSHVTTAELHLSECGKLRYDERLRSEMMKYVRDLFASLSPEWTTYLCMETPENWIRTFETLPAKQASLKEMFVPIRID